MSISTIIRFHQKGNQRLLKRALWSLYSQNYEDVDPIVVVQNFPEELFKQVERLCMECCLFKHSNTPKVINVRTQRDDARSELMNYGIQYHFQLGNQYLAFLDYDDLLFRHAYDLLSDTLNKTSAAIAFASVDVANVVSFRDYEFIYSLENPFKGKDKIDLIRENFCPLHSYLIDTTRIDKELLRFNPDLIRAEDYDFLLRVAGFHPCDFSNIGKKIGLYFWRNDETNSTPSQFCTNQESAKKKIWLENQNRLESLRTQYEIKFFASDFRPRG